MEGAGRAIPLIMYQEREGFKVTAEGLQFLNSIKTKIAVIAVAGKYRTGKSYMLNKIILNINSQGFGVGPTINPCTKGLWIWSQPIEIRTQNGEDATLLVIDSEGLGAFDEDANHDTRIFILTVLLSSFFIYNSVGSIDENALNNLSLIVNLTKNLQVRSSDSELDVDEVSSYFPSFLWVLRDFALQLVDQKGNAITAKEYLENSLQPQKGISDSIESKNRVRKLLKHFFRDRDCFALVRPSEDERVLQELDRASDSDLRPEFVRDKSNLRKLIYRRAKLKTFNGRDLTGELLAGLAVSYVDAINKGAVPTIEGAWQAVCNSESQKNIDLSSHEYDKLMRAQISNQLLTPEQLESLHKSCKKNAIKFFKEKALGDNLDHFEHLLKKKLLERYEYFNAQNDKKVLEKCDEICTDLMQEMQDKLKRGEFGDFQVFKREIEKKINEIKKSGPQGNSVEWKLKEVSSSLLAEGAEYISRSAMLEQENATRKISHQLEFVKSSLEAKKEEFSKEREYLKNRIQELESENYRLKAAYAAYELKIEELKNEKERLENNFKKKYETLKDDQKELNSELRSRYEETQKLYNDLQQKHSVELNGQQKELALMRQEINWKSQEISDLKKKRDEMDSLFKEMRAQLRLAREENEANENELKKLKSSQSAKSQEGNEAPNDWVRERNFLRNQVESLKSQIDDNKNIQEALVKALQAKSFEKPKEAEKIMSYSVDEMEDRCQMLEEKLEKLSNVKKMIDNASALQCKLCGEIFGRKVFNAHISLCSRRANQSRDSGQFNIVVVESVIKDSADQKSYTEFIITVTYRGESWTVNKRFKMLENLHMSLQREFSDIQLPDTGNLFVQQQSSSLFSSKKPIPTEEKKRACQQYLMELAAIPSIKNSRTFNEFLCVNQHFDEEVPVRRK